MYIVHIGVLPYQVIVSMCIIMPKQYILIFHHTVMPVMPFIMLNMREFDTLYNLRIINLPISYNQSLYSSVSLWVLWEQYQFEM